jgi:hypothetical protein
VGIERSDRTTGRNIVDGEQPTLRASVRNLREPHSVPFERGRLSMLAMVVGDSVLLSDTGAL